MARNRSSISLLMIGLYVRPSPNFSISSSQSMRSCISCNTENKPDQGHVTHIGQHTKIGVVFSLHSSIGSMSLSSSFACIDTFCKSDSCASIEKLCFKPLICSCSLTFFRSDGSKFFGINLYSSKEKMLKSSTEFNNSCDFTSEFSCT